MDKIYTSLPPGHGECPQCSGTGRIPLGPNDSWMRKWQRALSYYDPETDTKTCTNCGGQTMRGQAFGFVHLRPDGTPCQHKYITELMKDSYSMFRCTLCGHTYDIDSGD